MARTKKQTEVPGTERETDPELDAASADVYELTAKRLAAHAEEKLARAKLADVMRKKERDAYTYVDGEETYNVKRTETEKVSVKKATSGGEDSE